MTTEKDTSFHTGHRERLRQKFVEDKLVNYELLELLLSYFIPRRDVRALSRGLIQHFGGLHQVLAAPLDELTAYNGVGRNTAIGLSLVHKIMVAGYRNQLDEKRIFHNDEGLLNYCRFIMAGNIVEEIRVLYLDADNKLLSDELHSRGTVDEATLYPREIVKRALTLNARSLVLVHNHPTADKAFSTADVNVTQQLVNILNSVGIAFIDHYVVSGSIVYSARNLHLFEEVGNIAHNA